MRPPRRPVRSPGRDRCRGRMEGDAAAWKDFTPSPLHLPLPPMEEPAARAPSAGAGVAGSSLLSPPPKWRRRRETPEGRPSPSPSPSPWPPLRALPVRKRRPRPPRTSRSRPSYARRSGARDPHLPLGPGHSAHPPTPSNAQAYAAPYPGPRHNGGSSPSAPYRSDTDTHRSSRAR